MEEASYEYRRENLKIQPSHCYGRASLETGATQLLSGELPEGTWLSGNPVNLQDIEILGEPCYPELVSIPEPEDLAGVFRCSEDVPAIVAEAIGIGAKAVWLQGGIKGHPPHSRPPMRGNRPKPLRVDFPLWR